MTLRVDCRRGDSLLRDQDRFNLGVATVCVIVKQLPFTRDRVSDARGLRLGGIDVCTYHQWSASPSRLNGDSPMNWMLDVQRARRHYKTLTLAGLSRLPTRIDLYDGENYKLN